MGDASRGRPARVGVLSGISPPDIGPSRRLGLPAYALRSLVSAGVLRLLDGGTCSPDDVADIEQDRGDRRRLAREALAGCCQHLYAIEIVGVGVKVGVTGEPSKRLANHARDARNYRRQLGRWWVSVRHVEFMLNEALLIGWAGADTEYLPKSFDDVMAKIDSLKMTTAERLFAELPRPAPLPARRRSYFETYWESVGAARLDPRGVMSRAELQEVRHGR